jgi:hypothetical protein
VAWPGATDDHGVTAYAIAIDGAPAARVAVDRRGHTIEGLEERSEHAVTVVAYDEAGNASSPLSLVARTADETAPRFGTDARLTISDHHDLDSATTLLTGGRPAPPPEIALRWPAAEDAGGVARYRVMRGDEELASIEDGAGREHVVTTPSDPTRFAIVAVDRAGNESARLEGEWVPPPRSSVAAAGSRGVERVRDTQLLGAFRASNRGALADILGSSHSLQDQARLEVTGVGVARFSERPSGGGGGTGPVVGLGRLGPPHARSTPPTTPDVSVPLRQAE